MNGKSLERILSTVDDAAVVLDVGGWAKPFDRADIVLDHMPYATRGLYGHDGPGPERFRSDSWIQWDMCAREPWPLADKEIDFAICSQTLEDVRDPVWVCSELTRVAKAGYIEVPSRLEEQTYGIQGPWVGWGHHHWLADVSPGRVQFVFKHHVIHGDADAHFPAAFLAHLSADDRVQALWWEDSFSYEERTFGDAGPLDEYLRSFVTTELGARGLSSLRDRPSHPQISRIVGSAVARLGQRGPGARQP
ncbi:MAG: hypothetical protein ACYCV7_01335 [Acidimicrobiales bacterium]